MFLKPDLNSICVNLDKSFTDTRQLSIMIYRKVKKWSIFSKLWEMCLTFCPWTVVHPGEVSLLLQEIKLQAEVQVLNTPIIKVKY